MEGDAGLLILQGSAGLRYVERRCSPKRLVQLSGELRLQGLRASIGFLG